jgi:TonB family protein
MKRHFILSLAAAVLLVINAPTLALGQTEARPAQKTREEMNKVRAEMDAGARQYRAGDFVKAEAHFRKTLELDPEHRNAPLFLARSIQEQFRPGDMEASNLAKGEEAVEAYRRILSKDALNEDAFNAIVNLYRLMRNDEKAREAILARAGDASLPVGRRAALYMMLAKEDWQCSYNVTEHKDNKETVQQAEKTIITYKMPADSGEFYKARQCIARATEANEQALQLSPRNLQAWAFKTNLLRESAKLAEMEGDASQKELADTQYKEALAEYQKMTGETGGGASKAGAGGVTEAKGLPSSDPSLANAEAAAPTGGKMPISGGVLNGKAISKPAPVYPREAIEAGASGTVTVQILVDEEGGVATAVAVSGHPLLREAAASAARQARFSPTRLSGQPVKVTGVVTYNFVLGEQ